MKPKRSYQNRIVELNKSVGAISDIIIEWAKENAITHPAVRRKNNVTVCSICGNAMVYAGNSRMVKCIGQFMDSFPFNGKIELRGTSQMVYDYIADNAEVYQDYKLFPLISDSLTDEDILDYGRQTTFQKVLRIANNVQ